MSIQPKMPKSWCMETKPHKFCPGCGHPIVLKALGEVIDELEIAGDTVIGCDIGCSLLAWDFFNVDTIQTHHGRTTPLIQGICRADEYVIGIAYMGDGAGYAIGSQHLVNTANRNDKLLVLLINNTQYGMTGGQMSPTTLPGQKTETSPYGRDVCSTGPPFQGPEMVAAVSQEGSYVARATVANPRQMKKFIKKALGNVKEGRGFSFIEVLATCPTNWRTDAKQTWKFLEEDMERYFKVGELKVPIESNKEG